MGDATVVAGEADAAEGEKLVTGQESRAGNTNTPFFSPLSANQLYSSKTEPAPLRVAIQLCLRVSSLSRLPVRFWWPGKRGEVSKSFMSNERVSTHPDHILLWFYALLQLFKDLLGVLRGDML